MLTIRRAACFTLLVAFMAIAVTPAQSTEAQDDATQTLSAKRKKRGGGGNLICGLVQMRHYGITNNRYRLAYAWTDFPRTSVGPNAVVIQHRAGRDSAGNPGYHVSRITSVIDNCNAVVSDDKGTYERNICKGRVAVVAPDANGNYASTLHARAKPSRASRAVQAAEAPAPRDFGLGGGFNYSDGGYEKPTRHRAHRAHRHSHTAGQLQWTPPG